MRTALRLWDRLSIYLPVVLMGVLALMTYWLVRNTPMFGPAADKAAPLHNPDYTMQRFTVRNFEPGGRLKSEMSGDRLHHFPDTETLEITQAHLRGIGAAGQVTVATADRAITNADGSEVQLMGNARVVREARAADGKPIHLSGEFLHAFVREDVLRSHKPVTLSRDGDRFTGNSLEYRERDKVLELRGDVRAVLAPRKPR